MLSAVKPTNIPTLGNYLGAFRNWVTLQKQYDCLFFVVDLHAITIRQDPKELRERTLHVVANYLACGLDPEQVLLFIQSHVPQHAELAWVLNCYTTMGELSRMTQYKDKSSKEGQTVSAGLFHYPVLMAADILAYQTNLVPVGEDQKQHVELTRDIALRMMNQYGKDLFTLPEAFIPPVGARIMSLQDPTAKMSKSDDDPNGTISLNDSDSEIRKKIKRAVTDSGSEIVPEAATDPQKPGIRNLLTIQSCLTGQKILDIVDSYAGKQYGHLKADTAEIVAQALKPIREKTEELMKDRSYLEGILKKGAEQAKVRAQKTLDEVYQRVGFFKL